MKIIVFVFISGSMNGKLRYQDIDVEFLQTEMRLTIIHDPRFLQSQFS